MTIVLKFFSIGKFKQTQFSGLLILIMILAVAFSLDIITRQETAVSAAALYRALLYSLLIFAEFVAYYLFYRIALEHNEKVRLQIAQKRLADEKEFFSLSKKNYEDLKTLKHDLNNHFYCMQSLLAANRFDELKDYFKGVNEEFQSLISLTDSGNKTIRHY